MAIEGKDFVWFAPRNRFYYVPTGTRWVKKGVEAAIGTHAIEEIIKNRTIINREKLAQILGWPEELAQIVCRVRSTG